MIYRVQKTVEREDQMPGERGLAGSLELTCRGSTWIVLRLSSLDIQAPWLPCLQPGDQCRLDERPHCRRGWGRGVGTRRQMSHTEALPRAL